VLSYLHYLPPHRTRLSSNNPIERMKLEIRRCTRVGISPHRGACRRLIGMLLSEIHED
jgi:transposase-like protein